MSKMIIMRGLPGSGKSTLASELGNQMHAEYCYDDAPRPIILFTDEYFMVGGSYHWEARLIEAAHKWNQRRAAIACSLCWNVIIDNTNLTFSEMRNYFKIANDFGYSVELKCPTTEWAKSTVCCREKTTHDVPYDTIVKMAGRFESNDKVVAKCVKAFPDLRIFYKIGT